MYLKDGHNDQPRNGANGEKTEKPDNIIVTAIQQMSTLEDFTQYCHQHNIDMKKQWLLIDEHGTDNDQLSFGKQLAAYKEELGDVIYRLSGVKMTSRVHHDDIISAPADNTVTQVPSTPSERDLPAYCLTSHGASLDSTVWDNLLSGFVELGLIEPKGVADLKNLFGITRHTGRYKPLKEPVRFLSSKVTVSFLVAMIYGTFKYRLLRDVRVKNRVIQKGYYVCTPLIVTPSGNGPDEHLRTRDAYWGTLEHSAVMVSPTGHIVAGSKHGFATARKEDTPPETAAPLIALLLPMGCHRVEE